MSPEELDDLIEQWHSTDGPQPLYEFLGWTWEQYSTWVETNRMPDLTIGEVADWDGVAFLPSQRRRQQ